MCDYFYSEVPEIYAIVETGGKQYRVESGQVIDVDLMDLGEGNTVEPDRVLLIGDGEKVTVGTPTVEGAKVMATSQGDGRDKKIIVLKYKNKIRYRKKTGHRQDYTRLMIDQIVEPGAGTAKSTPKRTRKAAASEEKEDNGA